jgi:hypothetical protein
MGLWFNRYKERRQAMADWKTMDTAARSDDERQPFVLILQAGRRFVAQWDSSAGHFQGVVALDGVERELFYQEWPGRLHSPDAWTDLPAPPAAERAVTGSSPLSVPTGWVAVPEEPTELMWQKADNALSDLYRGDGGWIGAKAAREQSRLLWRAMLTGRPTLTPKET